VSAWPVLVAAAALAGIAAIGYRELRSRIVEQRAVRLRAQAKPIIDRRLEHLDGQVELSDLAAILAMDLSSRETSALVVGPDRRVLAGTPEGETSVPSPLLPVELYERALGGDPHVSTIVLGAGGRRLQAVLIPPRAWLPRPPAVVQLTSDLSGEEQRLSRLAWVLGAGGLGCAAAAVTLDLLGHGWSLLALLGVAMVAIVARRAGHPEMPELPELPAPSPPRADFTGAVRRMEAAFLATEASEQRMRRFIADASHELRTPLTSLGSAADVLLGGAKSDAEHVERIARVIRAQTERLGRLVEDLLLLARLDARAELRREPVELDVIVREHGEELSLAVPDRRIAVDADEGARVVGDADRLLQVLANLTANAVRHTAVGGRIAIAVVRNGAHVDLAVSDDGEGIAAADLPRVWERFFRADPARSGGGGTGLGLAIVREITEAHGGTASVESRVGEGSRFTLRFPAAPAGASQRILS
jgi:signal transduction histidine kinase